MTKQEILSYFPKAKKSGNAYWCLCPAHDDHDPSCRITFGKKRAFVKCFANCTEEEILRSVGLAVKDLYFETPQNYQSYNGKTSTPAIAYEYRNRDGELLYTKYVKYKEEIPSDGKKRGKIIWVARPNGERGRGNIPNMLFQLPLLKEAKTIYMVEGEKCATAVTQQGYVATTLDCGASSKWEDRYFQYLDGKEIIILPDNDEAGMKYARMLKKHLPWAIIKELPDLEEKEDVYDWLQKGHSMDEIQSLPEYISKKTDRTSEDKATQSEILLEFVEQGNLEYFLDDSNEPYVAIYRQGHREIYKMDSKSFSLWLQMLYYENTKRTIRADNLLQVVNVLSFKARDKGEKIKLFNRVAKGDSCFWYDMTDEKYSAIKISTDGWDAVNVPPILFERQRHQEPQAVPQHDGDINKIFEYVNVVKFKKLFLCWLVACFVPDIPHPMPIIYGQKGAAKSTTCELLKKIIDPSVMDTLSLCKDDKSLFVNLQSHYYLPFDNVSNITGDISDILCRAITGGAVQQRRFYTNGEDYIFKFKRCLTLNGIHNVASRSDLLDRSIMLELERIPEDRRREQQEVYSSFEEDRPYILGAIFDVLSKAMQIYPTIKLNKMPRMADFCRWGYAIGEAIGGFGNEFLKEYNDNRTVQNKEAIEGDVVATLIFELMRNEYGWEGRVSNLLDLLRAEAPKHGIDSKDRGIPQRPNQLSKRIKEVKSNLEEMGIDYEFVIKSDATYIKLTNNKKLSELPPYSEIAQ